MYEVGAMTALEERLNGSGAGFDIYVGCSAGSVVAALLANGSGPRRSITFSTRISTIR
jgi:predicted acylesterase/phospholipase RssA